MTSLDSLPIDTSFIADVDQFHVVVVTNDVMRSLQVTSRCFAAGVSVASSATKGSVLRVPELSGDETPLSDLYVTVTCVINISS